MAFVDPFGNLVSAAANDPGTSPVATALMAVLQGYSITRFNLVNDPATSAITQKTITSPKYGTFVWLDAPDPTATTTIEDLGAYGSAVEGSCRTRRRPPTSSSTTRRQTAPSTSCAP